MIKDLQQYIQNLADEWTKLGQWTDPSLSDCIDFIVEEAGEAHKARIRFLKPFYTRNNPQETTIQDVDEEVADTLIMCLRWFNLRQLDAGGQVLGKLAEMDRKRREAAFCQAFGLQEISPELRSVI